MKKNTILYSIALAGTLALTTSCADDFLDKKSSYQLAPETFLDSDDNVRAMTGALYNAAWYNFNDKFSYAMGDGRANNITAQYSNYIYPYTNFTDNSLSAGLGDAWGSFYTVVAQANNSIQSIEKYCSASVSQSVKTETIAEARFMRGVAYWYIGTLWGCGILYTNTEDYVSNYAVKAQPRADVIEFAIRDLEYAAKNLPKTQSNAGRVTRYAAMGMLSRVYLDMAGLTTSGQYDGTNVATDFNRGTRNEYYLTLAKKAAKKCIEESGASLLSDYAALFHYSTIDNNAESLFQLQWIAGKSNGSTDNSMMRFLSWSTTVGDTNAWGGATYCSYDLWEEFKEYADQTLGVTVDDAIRRHNSVASYGEEYPELSADASDPYIYGVTEAAQSQGANIKKYVIGSKKANGISEVNNSGINTYVLRLAEVYLNYVEATMGNNSVTTDAEALRYFNAIRTRAGMATKSKVTYEDLRHENRVEFAFEGLYWYQLVRRAYYQQQEVVNYVNNQYRNASYYQASTQTYGLAEDYTPSNQVATATAKSLILPMPDADQTKNPNLKTDASGNISTEPWQFGDREVDEATLFD